MKGQDKGQELAEVTLVGIAPVFTLAERRVNETLIALERVLSCMVNPYKKERKKALSQ
jgi:hypothetical protein